MLGALVSQSVARRLTPCNFYEAILRQDGHRLEHTMPPRDLQSWQQLPVSAIANFQPVIISDLSQTALSQASQSHPFHRFPALQNGTLAGILTRKQAETSLASGHAPKLEPAITCYPTLAIGDLQRLVVESTTLFVVLVDQQDGPLLGIVTLHDLLRAEMRLAKDGDLRE